MQLKKIFEILVLLLTIYMNTSCNFKNDVNNINNEDSAISNDNNLYINQLTYQQMQELQKNNVIYFEFNKYNITQEYEKILDQHINFLCNNKLIKLIIEGHTDERGTSEYNIVLGKRRANAIKIYLQNKGVDANRISTVSYGKEKPVIQGHDETVYAKNRRAVLIY